MGRKREFPAPKKKYHRGTWEIFWNWNRRRYSIYPGRQNEKDPGIETDFRQIGAALASHSPTFSPNWAASPGVKRYLFDRYGIKDEEDEEDEEDQPVPELNQDDSLAQYKSHLERHCARNWAVTSYANVKALHAFVPGGFPQTTQALASEFLESVLARCSVATRNRTLASCSRFFKWCIETERLAGNPFAALKNLREVDAEAIVYCTGSERDRILTVARSLSRPDWIAIPIAFFAGCRREEIFNLQWEDVNLDTRRIVIRKSKTGKKRLTPISKELLVILTEIKKERGHVVPRSEKETWTNQADRLVELVREHLCRPENPNLAGRASEAIGKRRFLMTDKALQAEAEVTEQAAENFAKADAKRKAVDLLKAAVKLAGMYACPKTAHDGQPWLPAERLGWNAWRHTFATLRAQAGVSLDKISSWMGNSYVVCKKHYAEFMLRDSHDEDIDK